MLIFIWFQLFLLVCTEHISTIEEFLATPIPKEAHELTGQALVDYVNQRQPFFEASLSPLSKQERQWRLMKLKYLEKPDELRKKHMQNEAASLDLNTTDLPESFDARDAWSDCPSIRYIRDQSNCGSCWAVSAAETMSDRLCVQSRGLLKIILSDTDILACCGYNCGEGCEGGYPIAAWKYIINEGVCSGGRYGEKDACKPYAFHPCGRHTNQTYYGECPKDHLYRTPKCKPYCQFGYGKRYKSDKVYGQFANYVYGEPNIQREIMTNGPVQAAFAVFEDFVHYKSGIYVHTAGKPEGGHAVKIIGWGVQNGTKYWTVANSWNTDWGEDGGYFRILRGENHCGIEEGVVAGVM